MIYIYENRNLKKMATGLVQDPPFPQLLLLFAGVGTGKEGGIVQQQQDRK